MTRCTNSYGVLDLLASDCAVVYTCQYGELRIAPCR